MLILCFVALLVSLVCAYGIAVLALTAVCRGISGGSDRRVDPLPSS